MIQSSWKRLLMFLLWVARYRRKGLLLISPLFSGVRKSELCHKLIYYLARNYICREITAFALSCSSHDHKVAQELNSVNIRGVSVCGAGPGKKSRHDQWSSETWFHLTSSGIKLIDHTHGRFVDCVVRDVCRLPLKGLTFFSFFIHFFLGHSQETFHSIKFYTF